jgi:hypothetical protein
VIGVWVDAIPAYFYNAVSGCFEGDGERTGRATIMMRAPTYALRCSPPLGDLDQMIRTSIAPSAFTLATKGSVGCDNGARRRLLSGGYGFTEE